MYKVKLKGVNQLGSIRMLLYSIEWKEVWKTGIFIEFSFFL